MKSPETSVPIMTHFHRVETALWFDIERVLKTCVLACIEAPQTPIVDLMPKETPVQLSAFIREMNVGYLHPRRDALHRLLNGASARPILVNPSTKKNLSKKSKAL